MTMEKKGLPIPELDDDDKRQLLRNTLWEPLKAHAILSKRRRNLRLYSYGAAAAVLLIVCLATFFWLNTASGPRYQYYQTKSGERKSVTLPDGSVLTLNVATRIGVDLNDWQKSRKVRLESGEVFFKVARNPAVPFIASTRFSNVKVLGTSFNVRAYRHEKEEIRVKTGKVQVENRQRKSTQVITPGLMATVTSESGPVAVQQNLALASDSWVGGVYHYEEQPLQKILSDLGRLHQLKFIVTDSKELSRNYTLELDNISLAESIRKLELMGGIKMERSENTIYVRTSN